MKKHCFYHGDFDEDKCPDCQFENYVFGKRPNQTKII